MAVKTKLLPSQGKQIYTTGPLAVRLMVCAEVQGAKQITLLPALWFEFAFSQLVATFHERPLTYPWCCLQLIATYLALKCASYSDYYYYHHNLCFVFECCWDMENNGQPLLCSSSVALMARVQFCHHAALAVTSVGFTFSQLLKWIPPWLCRMKMYLVCEREIEARNNSGTHTAGWKPSAPCPGEDLLFTARGRRWWCQVRWGGTERGEEVAADVVPHCRWQGTGSAASPSLRSVPPWAPFPALAPLCAWMVLHTLKLLFASFNHVLQLISCFLADSLS